MAQDIRKMFQEDKSFTSDKLEKGHQNRFQAKLEKALPQETKKSNNKFFFLKIAAVMVIALGVGFIFYNQDPNIGGNEVVDTDTNTEVTKDEEIPVAKEYQLSDVSPEFKKIENYYLANLNIELAKLEVNDENKALVDSFMEQLAELDKEYKRLNKEIAETGLNDSSIESMISNLQLRLELLFKLKNKLKEINQSQNKNYENHQA
ncbi:hypothetical protein [Salinimicrobium gaetbulicola]|uniref:Anti-sigma factor n=1 Tax=Salinimicrobium gaetbulicola TaxID=999702 RepID=A0ABW3IIV4_9FLAO